MPKITKTLSGEPLRLLLTDLEARKLRTNLERTDREGVWKVVWHEPEPKLELE